MGPGFESLKVHHKWVSLTQRVHPFPFRTRKLSSAVPKILVWRRTGKIGRCSHITKRTTVQLCERQLLWQLSGRQVGDINAEGPPVPIPNTEVKLCSAENTYLATDRENRSLPTYYKGNIFCFPCNRLTQYSSLAQSVERKRCFAPNEANNLADIYGVVIVQFHYIPP